MKRHRLRIRQVSGWCTACLASLACIVSDATASTIAIAGSDTMINLNRELTEEYGRQTPGTTFAISGGGSETGLDALMDGRVDIAAMSRELTPEELRRFSDRIGGRPTEIVIALDGLAIYVHSSNPVRHLTVDEVAGIFSGRIRNWDEVRGWDRPIVAFTRNKKSGTRTYMEAKVLNGDSITDRAHEVATTATLTAAVGRNVSGIGYGGIAYTEGADIIRLSPDDRTVPVWPSADNVSSGQYPLSRPLYYYINPNSMNEDVHRFIDWVVSEEGQRVVTFVGYFPAPPQRMGDIRWNDAPRGTPALGTPETTLSEARDDAGFGLTTITPRNLSPYGYRTTIDIVDDTPSLRERGQVNVRVRITRRVDDMMMRIGDDAVIPLTPDEDGVVQFTLRRVLANATELEFTEAEGTSTGRRFRLPLEPFLDRSNVGL